MVRPFGVILDISPQSHDEVVNRPSISVFLQTPHILEHRFPRDWFAFAVDQITKKVRLHQREWENLVSNSKLRKIKIERFVSFFTKDENMFWLTGRHRAVHGCLHPLSPAQ